MIAIAKYLSFAIINEFQYALKELGPIHPWTIKLVRNRRKEYETIFNNRIKIQ